MTKKEIMTRAWEIRKQYASFDTDLNTMSGALRKAWAEAKAPKFSPKTVEVSIARDFKYAARKIKDFDGASFDWNTKTWTIELNREMDENAFNRMVENGYYKVIA